MFLSQDNQVDKIIHSLDIAFIFSIKAGEAVVVTAEEMIDVVKENGPEGAARKVDVVITGTFAPSVLQVCFLILDK